MASAVSKKVTIDKDESGGSPINSKEKADDPGGDEGQSGGEMEEVKKKKKKKRLPKEERRKRREEEKWKSLYGPKDSHIEMISSTVFQNLNKSTSFSSATKSSPQTQTVPQAKLPSFDEEHDFPALVSSSATKPAVTGKKQLVTTTIPKPAKKAPDEEESGWETESELPSGSSNSQSVAKEIGPKLFAGVIKEGPSKSAAVRITATTAVSTTTVTAAASTSKKAKSKNPMVISLDALIQPKTKVRRELKKVKVLAKIEAKKMDKRTLGNTLDSSGPMLIKRGKMRDKPKKKKVTALKKVILISRLLRKVVKTEDSGSSAVPGSSSASSSTSNKTESLLNASNVSHEIKKEEDELPAPAPVEGLPQVEKYSPENLGDVKPDIKAILEQAESPEIKLLQASSQEGKHADENVFVTLLNAALNEQLVAEKAESSSITEVPSKAEEASEQITDNNDNPIITEAKKALHSRKFRPYCNMYVSKELHGHVIALMKELHRFQDRLYHMDPIKFQSRRRYVHGLKDTINYLDINKVVLVILAPDVESNNIKGGLDDKISIIIHKASSNNVPVVFSGNRFILGKMIQVKKSQVSAIAVLDKQGAEELFQTVLKESAILREKYENDLQEKIQQLTQQSITDASATK